MTKTYRLPEVTYKITHWSSDKLSNDPEDLIIRLKEINSTEKEFTAHLSKGGIYAFRFTDNNSTEMFTPKPYSYFKDMCSENEIFPYNVHLSAHVQSKTIDSMIDMTKKVNFITGDTFKFSGSIKLEQENMPGIYGACLNYDSVVTINLHIHIDFYGVDGNADSNSNVEIRLYVSDNNQLIVCDCNHTHS